MKDFRAAISSRATDVIASDNPLASLIMEITYSNKSWTASKSWRTTICSERRTELEEVDEEAESTRFATDSRRFSALAFSRLYSSLSC